jgi:hypothetical protein
MAMRYMHARYDTLYMMVTHTMGQSRFRLPVRAPTSLFFFLFFFSCLRQPDPVLLESALAVLCLTAQ